MPSLKQIGANRLNAAKSTGPRTQAGKTIASRNALRTGLHAKSQVIRGECATALDTLAGEYYDRFHPTRPEHRALVDTLISTEWLLRRLRRVEAEIWAYKIASVARFSHFGATRAVGEAFTEEAPAFALLQRRIDSTQRTFQRILAQLLALEPDPAPATEPQIGFVPSPESALFAIDPPAATRRRPIGFVPSSVPPVPDTPRNKTTLLHLLAPPRRQPN